MDPNNSNEPTYFVIDPTGSRYGPATLAQLRQWSAEGRVPSTSTIEDAMGTRMSPSELLGSNRSEGLPPVAGYVHNPYTMPTTQVPNHLVKAILSTLFCCLPFGIAGIVFASQVDGFLRQGDLAGAQRASNQANLWSNISIGVGLGGSIIWIVINILMAANR